jgi:hypothetical protein
MPLADTCDPDQASRFPGNLRSGTPCIRHPRAIPIAQWRRSQNKFKSKVIIAILKNKGLFL